MSSRFAQIVARIALFTTLELVGFTAFASYLFLAGTGLTDQFSVPLYQWWEYLWFEASDPLVSFWLGLSAGPPALLGILAAGAILYRSRFVRGWSLRRDYPPHRAPTPPIRGSTDNHGHATWESMPAVRRLWPAPDPLYGGVVVGEAYDPRIDTGPFSPYERASWGHGGTAPLLIDPCTLGSTHSLVIAGSGSFKTVSAVSSLLTWTGSSVVLDPAEELGPMLEETRRAMGHRVFVLSPKTAAGCGFNVLDWIDTKSPVAETDIDAVVEWICGFTARRDQTAQFFKDQGKAVIRCLLTHMLWDPSLSDDLKTLRTLRKAVAMPEADLRKLLKRTHEISSSMRARELAASLCDLPVETFGGIYANANQDTEWLSTRAYADLVCGSSFKTADITTDRVDVFLSLPLKALQATPAVARCIIGALLNGAYEADGNIRCGRILFLLDEAARLGSMQAIKVALGAGRKYGITLQLLYQSVGQIEQQWGRDGKAEWYEGASWRSYAAIKDFDTAKEVSETIGNYGVLSWSESQNSGSQARQFITQSRSWGRNINYSDRARPLIRPEELMNDLREDAAIVIAKNARPVLCGRAIYFRRPEFTARVAANRFARAGGRANAGP